MSASAASRLRLRRLEVDDLLGAPWEPGGTGPGYCCATIVHAVLTRDPPRGLGWPVPLHVLWARTDEATGAERYEQVLRDQAALWERVGDRAEDATELGDVIEQRMPIPGALHDLHISALVDLDERYAISSWLEGADLQRVERMARVRAVYRWCGLR